MNKKTLFIFISFAAIIAVGAFLWKKRKKKSDIIPEAQNSDENDEAYTLTPERFEDLIKKEPKLVAKYLGNLYKHMQQHTHLFDSEEQRKVFKQWLAREREQTLKNKEYRRNLEYWLSGVTDNPEASIIRAFRKFVVATPELTQIFSREAMIRAGKNFKDKDVQDDPDTDIFPSVLDAWETEQENTEENGYFATFFL